MVNRHPMQQNRHPIVLILGQLVIIALCVGYMAYIYKISILPDRDAPFYFRQAECLVMSKRLNTTGLILDRHRAEFLISYNVNGVQYSRWVSGNGLDEGFTQNRGNQENILKQYDVGRTYSCYYSPEDPQLSLLMFRSDWFSVFPLMLPALIGVIALYSLSRTLLNIKQF